jgi:hypothetical protein
MVHPDPKIRRCNSCSWSSTCVPGVLITLLTHKSYPRILVPPFLDFSSKSSSAISPMCFGFWLPLSPFSPAAHHPLDPVILFRPYPQPGHIALRVPVLVSERPRPATVYLVSRSLFILRFFVSSFLALHHLPLVGLFFNSRFHCSSSSSSFLSFLLQRSLHIPPRSPIPLVHPCSWHLCIVPASTEHV